MTRRRRRVNGQRNGTENGHGFNLATVAQMAIIPLMSAAIVLAGFYYVTRDELARHEVALNTSIPAEFSAERKAREQTRNEFLDKLSKLTDGIAVLNTNVAVQTEALKQIKDQLAAHR